MDGTAQYHCPSSLPPHAAGNIALVAILTVFLVTLVPLRVYVRTKIVKAFWWDDGLIVVALLLQLPSLWLLVFANVEGLGGSSYCINWSRVYKDSQPSTILGLFAVTIARLSIAILLYRLFKIHKVVTYFLGALMFLMVIFVIVNAVYLIKEIHHLSVAFTWIAGVISVVADLALATVPTFVLRKLQMKKNLKYAVMGVLALGYITAVFAIIRLGYLAYVPSHENSSSTVYGLEMTTFSELESSFSIIAATIPTLKPLVTKDRSSQGSRPVVQQRPLVEPSTRKNSDKNDCYPIYSTIPPMPAAGRPAAPRSETGDSDLSDIGVFPQPRPAAVYLGRNRMGSETV